MRVYETRQAFIFSFLKTKHQEPIWSQVVFQASEIIRAYRILHRARKAYCPPMTRDDHFSEFWSIGFVEGIKEFCEDRNMPMPERVSKTLVLKAQGQAPNAPDRGWNFAHMPKASLLIQRVYAELSKLEKDDYLENLGDGRYTTKPHIWQMINLTEEQAQEKVAPAKVAVAQPKREPYLPPTADDHYIRLGKQVEELYRRYKQEEQEARSGGA